MRRPVWAMLGPGCTIGTPAGVGEVKVTVLARRLNLLFWGLSVVVLVAAAGWGLHLFRLQREAERSAAAAAVGKGQALLSELKARLGPEEPLAEAGDRLAEAEALLGRNRPGEARKRAEEALLLLEPLVGRLEAPPAVGRVQAGDGVLRVEGAEDRPLGAGGEIPSGGSVQAGPRGLLLVLPVKQALVLGPRAQAVVVSAAGETGGPVVELRGGTFSAVAPPSVFPGKGLVLRAGEGEAVLFPGGAAEGEVQAGGLLLEVHRGSCLLRGPFGERTVAAGLRTQRLRLEKGGPRLLEERAAAPAPEEPLDGAVAWASSPGGAPVALRWEPSTASRVAVQVSLSPLFEGGMVRQGESEGRSLALGTLPPGQYFWRLRALSPAQGPWSPPMAFRVLLPSTEPPPADWKLAVDATPLGDAAVVRGSVTPRLEVTVNGRLVSVGDGGEFTGTFPFGPGREVEVAAFDGSGRRLIWRQTYP